MMLGYGLYRPSKKPKARKMGVKAQTLIKSAKHLKYVRSLHCIDPLCESRKIEAAHISTADVPKSERGGMGVKSSDVMTFPACPSLHHRMHQEGHDTVAKEVLPPGVTLVDYALLVIAPTSPDKLVRERAADLKGKL